MTGAALPFRSVQALFGNGVEKGRKAVELPLPNGVVLVVVAAGASHGQAHPDRGRGVDPVDHVLQLVLLGNGASLEVDHVVAVESGGQPLSGRGPGEQVAGQLLDGELVEGLVPVEGIDHPVPPEPHVPVAVDVVAVGVGVAAGVEPLQGHPLTVAPGGEEPFHHLLVGPGAAVPPEKRPPPPVWAAARSGPGSPGGSG